MKRTNILLTLAMGLAVSLVSAPVVYAHGSGDHSNPPVISNVSVTPRVTNNPAGLITISATITTVDNNLWHPYFEVHAPGNAGVIYGWMGTISSGTFNYSVNLQDSANFMSPVTSFADFYAIYGGGVYEVVVGASDFLGFHGYAAAPVYLSIHTIPPVISNVAVTPNVTNNPAVSITISATITTGDSGLWHPYFEVYAPGDAGAIYGWMDSTISSGVFNYSVDLQDSANFKSPVTSFAALYAIHGGGVYRVVVGVSDFISGGFGYSAPSIFLTIDTIGPQVTINHPTDGTTTPSAVVTVSAEVNDNLSEVISVKAALNEVELTYDETEGEYSGLVLHPMQGFDITVTAKDAAGNEGSDTVSIIKVHDMGQRSKP